VKPYRNGFPEGNAIPQTYHGFSKDIAALAPSVNGSHSGSVILTQRLLHLVLIMHKILTVFLPRVARISHPPGPQAC
jgi:hypothetical protein